ncbi:hypothetical protein HYT45_02390 [Candidatus Uhrbacteria bacterium]|nr:hypothetical protein [Candidatus Uhrbacteria bacterium]
MVIRALLAVFALTLFDAPSPIPASHDFCTGNLTCRERCRCIHDFYEMNCRDNACREKCYLDYHKCVNEC